jgi:hypothetical protein
MRLAESELLCCGSLPSSFCGFQQRVPAPAASSLPGWGRCARHVAAANFLIELLEYVNRFQMLVVLAQQAETCQRLLDILLHPRSATGIFWRPFA